MKYARYRDDLAFLIDTQKFVTPDEPDAWSAYQAWLTTPGNTPVDGNLGQPGLSPRHHLALSDYRMARIGEDVMNALIAKGVLAMTDLPPIVQQLIADRETHRQSLATW